MRAAKMLHRDEKNCDGFLEQQYGYVLPSENRMSPDVSLREKLAERRDRDAGDPTPAEAGQRWPCEC